MTLAVYHKSAARFIMMEDAYEGALMSNLPDTVNAHNLPNTITSQVRVVDAYVCEYQQTNKKCCKSAETKVYPRQTLERINMTVRTCNDEIQPPTI